MGSEIDDALRLALPLVHAPVQGDLEPLSAGMRIIVASNGVFREIATPWLHAIACIGATQPLPYGAMQERVTLRCGIVPPQLFREFTAWAEQSMPNECAAAFIWSARTGQWRMAPRAALSASGAHVTYAEAPLSDGESMVVDIHSHARFSAGFSSTDDRDDLGSIKICSVIGDIHQPGARTQAHRINLIMDRFGGYFDPIGLFKLGSPSRAGQGSEA